MERQTKQSRLYVTRVRRLRDIQKNRLCRRREIRDHYNPAGPLDNEQPICFTRRRC